MPEFGEIAERLRRSTVQVFSHGHDGGGSGVIWSTDGRIVTNSHVARSAEADVVLWDGRKLGARLEGRDARRDLAVLKVADTSLPAAAAGDSDSLRPGELVIAVGSPLGFAGALSTGVVHSLGTIRGMGRERWIGADVRLAPGNSGGPLANAQGHVIGINTAIFNGLGLAVPANAAADFLRRGARPALGVTLEPMSHGMRIVALDPDGAAAAASLREGDILVGTFERLTEMLDSGRDTLRVPFFRGDTSRLREVFVRGGAKEGGGGVIKLAIAAESAVVRAGLEALVASHPGIEMAGAYPDLGALEALRPDVVLAAFPLEELPAPGDGYNPAVVLLTNERHPAWTQDAFRAGVRALLGRDVSAAEILAAVESAASGMAVIDPRELESLLAPSSTAQAATEPHTLTARELEVLRMMAEGAANKEIAWKLGISDHTVKFHVASILAKLHAASRTEAVTLGVRKGLILL